MIFIKEKSCNYIFVKYIYEFILHRKIVLKSLPTMAPSAIN